MKKKYFILFLILFIYNQVNSKENSKKIGFLGDFTSVSKDYTTNVLKSGEIIINEINNYDGLLNKNIQLIIKDGGKNPRKNYDLAISLIEKNKVVAILGGASSSAVIIISEVCKKNKIPFLVRQIDGQMSDPVYFGRLVYINDYFFAVWSSIIEIPSNKTCLSEREVINIKKNLNNFYLSI